MEESKYYIATKITKFENRIEIFESYSGQFGYKGFLLSDNGGKAFRFGLETKQTYNWIELGYQLKEASAEDIDWFKACKAAKHIGWVKKPETLVYLNDPINLFAIF